MPTLASRTAVTLLLVLPGIALAVLAFLDGGFFADVAGGAAAVLGVLLAIRLLVARDAFEAVSGRALLAGGALVLLAAQVACVVALVVAARRGHERAAWSLTIASAVLAVALLLAQGSALA